MNILRRFALVLAVIIPSAAFAEAMPAPASSCCHSSCCPGCPLCQH